MTQEELAKLLNKEDKKVGIEAISSNGNKLFTIRSDKKSMFINLTSASHKVLKALGDVEGWKIILSKVDVVQKQEEITADSINIDDL